MDHGGRLAKRAHLAVRPGPGIGLKVRNGIVSYHWRRDCARPVLWESFLVLVGKGGQVLEAGRRLEFPLGSVPDFIMAAFFFCTCHPGLRVYCTSCLQYWSHSKVPR